MSLLLHKITYLLSLVKDNATTIGDEDNDNNYNSFI